MRTHEKSIANCTELNWQKKKGVFKNLFIYFTYTIYTSRVLLNIIIHFIECDNIKITLSKYKN